MKILSLNVSLTREVQYKGEAVSTGIYKTAVNGPRMVRKLNIDGDQQADLKLHGGEHKAVFAFPAEHYAYFQNALNQPPYEPGQFGENLTTLGLLESAVHIGNRYRIGDALFEVSQPRSPCYKFGIKMLAARALAVCINSMKTGFYFRVLREGKIQAGDSVELEFENSAAPTVEAIHRLYYLDKKNLTALRQAADCELLTQLFRDEFRQRIAKLEIGGSSSAGSC